MPTSMISIDSDASRVRGAVTRIAFGVATAAAGVLLTWSDLHAQNPSSTGLTLGSAARMAADRKREHCDGQRAVGASRRSRIAESRCVVAEPFDVRAIRHT